MSIANMNIAGLNLRTVDQMVGQLRDQVDLGKIFGYGRLAKAWLRGAAGVNHPGHAFDLEKALDDLGLLTAMKQKIQEDPKAEALVKERKMLKTLNLDELAQLPDGTLGRHLAEQMNAAGRSFDTFSETEVTDDTSYIAMRMRQTKDLWRALSGFDLSPSGEVAFQAFVLAQGGGSMPAVNMAYHLAKTAVTDPTETQVMVNELCKGWLAGLKSEPFFSIDWEMHLDTSLSEMRRRYMHSKQLEEAEAIFNEAVPQSSSQEEGESPTDSSTPIEMRSKKSKKSARADH